MTTGHPQKKITDGEVGRPPETPDRLSGGTMATTLAAEADKTQQAAAHSFKARKKTDETNEATLVAKAETPQGQARLSSAVDYSPVSVTVLLR